MSTSTPVYDRLCVELGHPGNYDTPDHKPTPAQIKAIQLMANKRASSKRNVSGGKKHVG